MRTLLSFSGGLDSIYVLWKELTETSNDVTAVCFDSTPITEQMILSYSIKATEPADGNETTWECCQRIIEAIQPLTRSCNLIRMAYDPQDINPTQVQYNHGAVFRAAEASRQLNAGSYDCFVTGHCRDNDGFSASVSPSWRPGTASSLSMQYFKAHAHRGTYAFPLYEMQYTTAYALAQLPQELLDLQSSALSGNNSNYKVAIQTYAKRLLVEGNTPAQIYDIITQKSVMPNNMWRSQKRWLAEEVEDYKTNLHVDWPMPDWASSYTVPG